MSEHDVIMVLDFCQLSGMITPNGAFTYVLVNRICFNGTDRKLHACTKDSMEINRAAIWTTEITI